jgi:hypothetical protein
MYLNGERIGSGRQRIIHSWAIFPSLELGGWQWASARCGRKVVVPIIQHPQTAYYSECCASTPLNSDRIKRFRSSAVVCQISAGGFSVTSIAVNRPAIIGAVYPKPDSLKGVLHIHSQSDDGVGCWQRVESSAVSLTDITVTCWRCVALGLKPSLKCCLRSYLVVRW